MGKITKIENNIIYNVPEDKIFLGKFNAENGNSIGIQKDITVRFLRILLHFIKDNVFREVKVNENECYLLIKLEKNKEGIEKTILTLNNELNKIS
jgi:hypothetical protein